MAWFTLCDEPTFLSSEPGQPRSLSAGLLLAAAIRKPTGSGLAASVPVDGQRVLVGLPAV